MLATKGHPKRKSAGVHQVIISHIEEHSKKPDIVRNRIIELVGDLPRVELFAREKRTAGTLGATRLTAILKSRATVNGREVILLSDNWVVQNLENALETWNSKLAEIWKLITQSPEQFKGGTIWNVIVNIHGAVQAIGLALLVLFFVVGVMKTCGSFAELKKPEHALKVFIRFALAKGAVTYGLELMMALFNIVQGLISTIMTAAGFGAAGQTVLPSEIVTAVEDCGFLNLSHYGR